MSNFEFGKEAAFEEMIEYADAGYGLEDLVDLATETINDDEVMNKIASEEDFDFQLGVEAFCHEFMAKTASLMAEYDTSELDELEKIAFILDELYEDFFLKEANKGDRMAQSGQLSPEAIKRMYSGQSSAAPTDRQKRIAELKAKVTGAENPGGASDYSDRAMKSRGHQIPTARVEAIRAKGGDKAVNRAWAANDQRAVNEGRARAGTHANQQTKGIGDKIKGLATKRNAGIAGATAGTLALAAGGRHLYKKRQARKAQEQGQQKAASEIDHAVAILQEAGLLD